MEFFRIFASFCIFTPDFQPIWAFGSKTPFAYSYYMPYFDTYSACIYQKISLKIFYFTHLGLPKAPYQL